jgi:alpha-mannosidase
MSWAMNNHWMVNFKDSQEGAVTFRYKLTTHSGSADMKICSRYGAEAATEPIVLRDFIRNENIPQSGSFIRLSPANEMLMTTKPAEDGNGIIIRLQNPSDCCRTISMEFPIIQPKVAYSSSPLEETGDRLDMENGALKLEVQGRSLKTIRISF